MKPQTPVFAEWASGNYSDPGEEWDGLPKRVVPADDGFVPSRPIAVDEVNDVLAQRGEEGQNAADAFMQFLGQLQVNNWHGYQTPFAVGVGTRRFSRVRWAAPMAALGGSGTKPFNQGIWYMTQTSVTDDDTNLFYSVDQVNWNLIGVLTDSWSSPTVFAVGRDGSVVGTSNDDTKVSVYTASSGVIADSLIQPVGAISMEWSCMESTFSSGGITGIVAIGYSADDNKNHMFTTPDGSSYSDVSTFIPTSPVDLQAADTSTGDMQDNGWKFVSGGATGLNVAFTGLTAATCAGYILVTNSFSLGQTCETVPYSGSYRCRALAYSDQHGFILLASDGTDSKLYTSTNGTSWTLRFTLTAHHLTGVSACGDLICMAEMDTAAFGWNENPCGLWYTTSELSYTPHRVPTFVLPHASVSLGNSKFIYPQVTCARDQDGAYQFCAYNTAALALSLTAGRFLR